MDKVLVASGSGVQVLRCSAGHHWARPTMRGPAPKWCAQHRPVKKPPLKPTAENAAKRRLAVELAKTGMTLRDIGKACGVSYEAVRLWLNSEGFGPEQRELAQWRKRETERETRALAQLNEAKRRNASCRVCGTLLMPDRKLTCSNPCAEAWPVLRVHTEEGRLAHRMAVAKSTLKNAHKRSAVQVAWAKRVLEGDTEARKRHHFVRGSRADRLARQFGWPR